MEGRVLLGARSPDGCLGPSGPMSPGAVFADQRYTNSVTITLLVVPDSCYLVVGHWIILILQDQSHIAAPAIDVS